MIDKKKVLKELEEEFEKTKKEIGFAVTLDELDSAFGVKNAVLGRGFVPEDFYRVLCSSIAQDYRDWHGYLNNLMMPNPNFYASQTEAKLFSSEEDKKMLWKLMKKTMEFSSRSSIVTIKADKALAGIFIDEAYQYWVNEFSLKLVEIMAKVNEAWKKE